MAIVVNLSSPVLDVVEVVNDAEVEDIICFVVEKNGIVSLSSSTSSITLLTLFKLELDKEIQSLVYSQYIEEDSD